MGHEEGRVAGRLQTISKGSATASVLPTVAGSGVSGSGGKTRSSYQRVPQPSAFDYLSQTSPRKIGYTASATDIKQPLSPREDVPTAAKSESKERAAAKAQSRDSAVDVGGCSEIGAKQENQDVYNVQRLSPVELYISVLDGHGAAGGDVARQASIALFSYLNQIAAGANHDLDAGRISRKQGLRSACLHTHRVMCEGSSLNTRLSGSTVTVAIVRKTLLTVAWLGDSRAVLGKEDRHKPGRMRAVQLTRDHNCDDMVEAARIRRCGGKVQQYYYCGRFVGPKRIWLKEPGQRMPGLVVTRSVGDELAHSLGCIADPEMLEIELTPRDKILIVASDGVWDGLSNQRAIDIAAGCHTSAEASRAVVHAALENLHRLGMGDNVTAVVCFLPVPL